MAKEPVVVEAILTKTASSSYSSILPPCTFSSSRGVVPGTKVAALLETRSVAAVEASESSAPSRRLWSLKYLMN